MELNEELARDITDIKDLITSVGRYKLIDSLNEVVKLATSKQFIEETLDESYEALQPTGGIIIEDVNIYNYGKDGMERVD